MRSTRPGRRSNGLPREFPQSPLVGTRAPGAGEGAGPSGRQGRTRSTSLRAVQQRPASEVAGRAAGIYRAGHAAARAEPGRPGRADALKQARQKFEGQLNADPTRPEWVPLLALSPRRRALRERQAGRGAAAFDQAVQAARRQADRGRGRAARGCQCSVRGGEEEDRGHREGEAEAEPEARADRRDRQPQSRPRRRTSRTCAQAVRAAGGALQGRRCRRARPAPGCSTTRPGPIAAAGDDPAPAYTQAARRVPGPVARGRGPAGTGRDCWPTRASRTTRSSSSRRRIDKEPTDKPTPPETIERIRLRLGGGAVRQEGLRRGAGAVRRGRGQREVAAPRARGCTARPSACSRRARTRRRRTSS